MTLISYQEEKDSHLESEIYYRTLLNSMFEDIIVVDRNYRIVDVNNTFLVSSGHGREQVIGRYCYELSHGYNEPCDKHGEDCRLAQVFETGESHNCRHEHLTSDGSKVLVDILLSPLKDQNGKITYAIESVRNISHRKESEEALLNSEGLLKATFDSTADGILVVNKQGQITHTNSRFAEMWGIPERALAAEDNKKLLNYILDHFEEPQSILSRIQELYQSSQEDFETLHLKDGRVIERFSSPLIREGNVSGRVWSFRDITERKRAENLIHTQRDLGLALSSTGDLHEGLRLCVEAALHISGMDYGAVYHFDETSGSLDLIFHNVPPPGFVKSVPRYDEASDKTQLVMTGKPVYTQHQKTEVPLDEAKLHQALPAAAVIPFQHEGRVIGCLNIGSLTFDHVPEYSRDTLETIAAQIASAVARLKVEDALKESEQKYRTVLEANPDPVVVYDIEGKVIYFNPAFERVFGWSLEDRLGKKMDLFVPAENWPETRMMIDKVLAGESFSGIETNRFDKRGKTIPVSISGACYRDRNGNPKVIIANLRDISEHKKLQVQLQQAQKMEAIGTLAGGIAHDFNNILFPIIGYTEMTLEDVPPDSKARNNLSEILRATHRAKELIQQILTFSRKSDNKRNPLILQPIIKEALRLLRASLPTTIKISQNIYKECGPVMANPTQIHQVLINLCTNAYHAMHAKGGLLEVTLTEKEISSDDLGFYPDMVPGHYLLLIVSDTGHGMNKAVAERIFEPYFTLKETGKSSGMGLSIVHGIIKSHNGHIRVYSEPGKGTAFHIYLPRITTDTTATESCPAEPLPTGHEHILLVDDEQQIVQMEKQLIEHLGYQVTARTSSVEALEAFKANRDRFDLVITDMTMPNMTGDMLAKELMIIRPDIPVILCTGYSNNISEEKVKAIGIRAFAMKPVVKSELAKKIRDVLDQERAQ